jgi:hypothetical protein
MAGMCAGNVRWPSVERMPVRVISTRSLVPARAMSAMRRTTSGGNRAAVRACSTVPRYGVRPGTPQRQLLRNCSGVALFPTRSSAEGSSTPSSCRPGSGPLADAPVVPAVAWARPPARKSTATRTATTAASVSPTPPSIQTTRPRQAGERSTGRGRGSQTTSPTHAQRGLKQRRRYMGRKALTKRSSAWRCTRLSGPPQPGQPLPSGGAIGDLFTRCSFHARAERRAPRDQTLETAGAGSGNAGQPVRGGYIHRETS